MKVCHFVASVGLGRGDAFVDLANVLAERIEVVILAPRGARFAHNLVPGVRLVEYDSRNSRFTPLLYLELGRLLRQMRPDIVHTHFAKATEIFWRLNRFLKIPQVATKHNPRKGKIYNRLENVIAVSQGVAESIVHNRVRVIYNGIRPVPVAPAGKNPVFTIRAVGRLDRIKGFDRLIRAVAKLDFDFRLEIAGEGEERDALAALIDSLGLEQRVRLLGFREDIPELLAGADLQVMSSSSEGFSLAMVEALFYAPVFISTRVSGCSEILDPRLFAEEGDLAGKITEVRNRYDDYREIFRRVRERFVDRLRIDRIAQDYIDYYTALLRG